MPSFGNLLTVPPPGTLYAVSMEDDINLTRVTATRDGLVTGMGGWMSGDPAGVDPDQPARFVIYADDGTTLRPGAYLGTSVEGIATGNLPQTVCIRLAVDGAPIPIAPGTYWVGLNTGNAAGIGEWRIHGSADPGRGILIVPAVPYPGAPDPFPPAGGTIFTNTAAMGAVFTQVPTQVTGSVCGTFLCGTRNVGSLLVPFNTSGLLLKPRVFSLIEGESANAGVGKPQMILRPKAFVVAFSAEVEVSKPPLLLLGKTFAVVIPDRVILGKPLLLLGGKAFDIGVDVIAAFNKPSLILKAARAEGKFPGLLPPVSVDLILASTSPVETISPPASAAEDLILVPTYERFL